MGIAEDTGQSSYQEGDPARISVPIHGNKPLKVGLQRHLMKVAGIDESEL